MRRVYGKYRGTVVDNVDPLQIGRIIAMAPDALREVPSTWAMPCVPAAGSQSGVFVVPPIGSAVWIEFEGGNPDYPIWSGGFWRDAGEVPILAVEPPPIPPGQTIVLQTPLGAGLVLSDATPTPETGGVILRSAGGAMIVVNDAGVTISNGQGASITLVGPTVAVNGIPLPLAEP